MKFKILIILMFIGCIWPIKSFAVVPIRTGNRTVNTIVKELPSSTEYTVKASDGNLYHADLAVRHKEFSLWRIPLWNYGDYEYVFQSDGGYMKLNSEWIHYLQARFSGIPTEPERPFWNRIGGKLVIIGIFILIFIAYEANQKESSVKHLNNDSENG